MDGDSSLGAITTVADPVSREKLKIRGKLGPWRTPPNWDQFASFSSRRGVRFAVGADWGNACGA